MDDDLATPLEFRKALVEAAQMGLEALTDRATANGWPPDERAALADERDNVADESDALAVAFDERADRKDDDARFRQSGADTRALEALPDQSSTPRSTFGRYTSALDRKGTVEDRMSSAADRRRSAAARDVAADRRRGAAADREEAAVDRAKAENENPDLEVDHMGDVPQPQWEQDRGRGS